MKNIFKIIVAVFFVSTFMLLSGCNTAAGFGKDLQVGGQNIQNAAEDKNN